MSFRFQTSSSVKTVDIVGSWDNYAKMIPMSKEGRGSWKAPRLPDKYQQSGERYWYYFLIDNHKYDIDPDIDYITEKTTKRKMNILDIPVKRSDRQHFDRDGVAHGRPLSPERIVAPRPSKPAQAYSHFTTTNKSRELAINTLSRRLAYAKIDSSDESTFESDSDVPSDPPSLHTSSSDDESDRERRKYSGSSSDSSSSRGLSPITPTDSDRGSPDICYCHKFGITRSGAKIKVDCEGKDCHFRPLPVPTIRKDDSRDSRARIEERKPTSSYKISHRDSKYDSKYDRDSRYDSKYDGKSSRRR